METITKTFNEGRRCKHCDTPIPDQAHDSRDFCPRKVEEDGSVTDCKDNFHTAERQKNDPPYRAQMAFLKQMTKNIQALYAAQGPVVTVEQVNRYGIQLPNAVKTSFHEGLPRFSFIWHTLELMPNFKIQIQLHENPLF